MADDLSFPRVKERKKRELPYSVSSSKKELKKKKPSALYLQE